MLKSYEEVRKTGGTQAEALWNIARELSRKNDLLEIDMLCKTADAIRSAAKSSSGDLHYEGYAMAEELACVAHKKIAKICDVPNALEKED